MPEAPAFKIKLPEALTDRGVAKLAILPLKAVKEIVPVPLPRTVWLEPMRAAAEVRLTLRLVSVVFSALKSTLAVESMVRSPLVVAKAREVRLPGVVKRATAPVRSP